MMDFKLFWRCLFSPVLYSIHKGLPANVGKYDPTEWERWGDNFITSFVVFRALTIYTSPVLVFLMARRGYFTLGGALYLAKISLGIGVLVGASYCIRCYGRLCNSKYKEFIDDLESAKSNYNSENKKKLRSYDFEFSAWPVDFECRRRGHPATKRSWTSILSPCGLLSYFVIHTVGIRLIYPGSIPFINYLMGSFLIQGRHRLVVNEGGLRFKLKTEDGNHIDTMFLDRRNDITRENGQTLIICSEGNAGFYEIGIMATPVEGNYSVLGWNHPGFGGSTGLPYLKQEENAVDAVLQFATNELGFKPQNIVLFGWSIGGFSTAYAAMNYPEVKAVIVDASFDDLLPLAVPRMPLFLEPVVRQAIRLEANLDVARKLSNYPGPMLLVRRAQDEVICVEFIRYRRSKTDLKDILNPKSSFWQKFRDRLLKLESVEFKFELPDDISTNRGNHLLHKILSFRYPNLFFQNSEEALAEWLSTTGQNQTSILNKYHVNEDRCKQILSSYFVLNEQSFPLDLGDGLDHDLKTQLLLYLASKYFVDFDSTHCTILPLSHFDIPTLPSGE